MSPLNVNSIHCKYTPYAYIAFKHGKDATTVLYGLVGVYGLHCNPNPRTIYLWFEDMQHDWFTLQKRTQPSRPRSGSARTPSITKSEQKMAYKDLRMSVRD